jgi:hypothetical protein
LAAINRLTTNPCIHVTRPEQSGNAPKDAARALTFRVNWFIL